MQFTASCSTVRPATRPGRPSCSVQLQAGRLLPAQARSNVKCNFREGSSRGDITGSTPTGVRKPVSNRYAGYSDDPAEALKAGWDELVQRWNDWNPEDRNQTLAYSAGALLVLYLANSLLNAIEAVPLVPNLLKVVGYSFSIWFYFRYVLFAEGRSDLVRDFTIEKITGRSAIRNRADSLEELARRTSGAMDEPLSREIATGDGGPGRGYTGSISGPGVRSGSAPGYQGGGGVSGAGVGGSSAAADGVSGALHDLDQLADDLSAGGGPPGGR